MEIPLIDLTNATIINDGIAYSHPKLVEYFIWLGCGCLAYGVILGALITVLVIKYHRR